MRVSGYQSIPVDVTLNRAVMRALERFARNSKLLSLLDRAGLERLAASGGIEHREEGENIVVQGERGQTFYLLVAGNVRVLVRDAQGEREVATLDPGNFFGEIGTLTEQPRSATVHCVTPVELVVFERLPVLNVLMDYPAAREVIGEVGLARSEENQRAQFGQGLAEALEDDDDEIGGLADLLEGPE
ncbi:MAG: cyclic nucleotide-binding domain-containing protein [Myxococcota bacterium]